MSLISKFVTPLVATALLTLSASAATQPNIVLLMFDDVSPDLFGAYGLPDAANTPVIDTMAQEGVLFRTAYGTAMCAPARVEIMTGRYGQRTGVYHNSMWSGTTRNTVYTDNLAFGKVMKEAGYATAIAGKWHAGNQMPYEADLGFDEYCLWENLKVIDDLDGIRGNNLPAFDGLMEDAGNTTSRYWHPGYVKNHELMDTGPSDYGPQLEADFIMDFMSRKVAEGTPFLAYWPTVAPHGTRTGIPTNPLSGTQGALSDGDFKSLNEYMDGLVGQVKQKIIDLGIADKTIFIITADNGTAVTAKTRGIERGCHVLSVMWGAGVQARGVTDELTDLTDIFPTLAEFGGATLPNDYQLDGQSLVPFLTGKSNVTRPWIHSFISGSQIFRKKNYLLEVVNPILGLPNGRFYYTGNNRYWGDYSRIAQHDSDSSVFINEFLPLMAAIPAVQETDPVFTDTSSPTQSKAVDFLTDYKTESERTKHLFNHSNYEGVNGYGYKQDLAGYLANLNGTQAAATLTTSPALPTSATSANLLFNVLTTGGDAPDITVYWGTSDGGTSPAAWDHTISVGARSVGAFSTAITGLIEGAAYYFTVRASNDQGTVWGSTQSFTAAGAANTAPAFKSNPTDASTATAGLTYVASIDGAATDAEGDPLTYSKTSGPAWLSVAPNGQLSGTPSVGDVGDNVFTVQVSDGMGTDTITLNVAVSSTQSPYSAWTLGAFSKPGQLNTNPLDDFDTDGYSNQFEYYLGLNPESAANDKQPTASISGNYGALTFTYRTDNAALSYQIETATDLSGTNWTTRNTDPLDTGLVLINGPTPNPNEGTATVTYRYDTVFPDTPSLFFKIKVSE